MFMRSTPHYVEMQIQEIRRFAFHVFLLPFVAESMVVVADEEGRAAFFVPLRQPVPGGSRHKATTTIIMQTTASIQRTAHLRPLSVSKASIEAWLKGKSKRMTRLAGFAVSRREVLRVYLAFGLLGLAAAAAEVSIVAALLLVTLAGYNVHMLNVEQKGGKA